MVREHLQSFNSTLVRLKERNFLQTMSIFMRFNSTLVRLKVPDTEGIHAFYYVFQFHFGTIKRGLGLIAKTIEYLFQFHFGTIKSLLIGR